MRSVSGGNPRTSSARAIEKCAWSLAYTRAPASPAARGGSPSPRSRARWMSRATVSPMMLAITPPDVSAAHDPSPNPIRVRSQVVTSSSTSAPIGPAAHTSTPWFTHCASSSPATDIGSGGGVK